jgi:hypothetical protein
MKTTKGKESRHVPWLATLRGYRGMLKLQDGTRKNDKHLFTRLDLHKLNNTLVSALFGHF